MCAAYWIVPHGLLSLLLTGPLTQGWYHPTWAGTFYIYQENVLQSWLQASLLEACSQLRFLFPDNYSLLWVAKTINQHMYNSDLAFYMSTQWFSDWIWGPSEVKNPWYYKQDQRPKVEGVISLLGEPSTLLLNEQDANLPSQYLFIHRDRCCT